MALIFTVKDIKELFNEDGMNILWEEFINYCLEKNIDINAKNRDGLDILHFVCKNQTENVLEIIQYCTKSGLDVPLKEITDAVCHNKVLRTEFVKEHLKKYQFTS